jgi:hypothetical protein
VISPGSSENIPLSRLGIRGFRCFAAAAGKPVVEQLEGGATVKRIIAYAVRIVGAPGGVNKAW